MPLPDPFKPSEGANHPLGEGKGIHPGRVVWVRDASATSWDGVTGHWWDDAYTNQKVVHGMISRLLRDLTGRKNDKQAWDALFRSFNETHKWGRSGYRPGERIAIKINCNQDRSRNGAPLLLRRRSRDGGPRGPQNGLPSPHVVAALVTQLIEMAGVRGEDIMIYDVTGMRNVGQPIYNRIRANSNPQFQAVQFLVGDDYNLGGRMSPTPDMANPIRFSKAELPAGYLPQQVTEAKYMINMALLRPHGMAGVTLDRKEPLRFRPLSERWRLVADGPAQQRHAHSAHGLLQCPGGPDGPPAPGRQDHALHAGRPVHAPSTTKATSSSGLLSATIGPPAC